MPDPALLTLAADRVSGALGGAGGHDEILARQMQALSLAVHIPLVCFGVAFPALMLFTEGRYLRARGRDIQGARQAVVEGRGRRCSRSAWSPERCSRSSSGCCGRTSWRVRRRVRVGFTLEGSRSSSRPSSSRSTCTAGTGSRSGRTSCRHSGRRRRASPGSSCVIARQRLDEPPSGFKRRGRAGRRPAIRGGAVGNPTSGTRAHMYFAAFMVGRVIVAGVYASRGCAAGATATTAPGSRRPELGARRRGPCRSSSATGPGARWPQQPVKLAAIEGLPQTNQGRTVHLGGWYDVANGSVRDRDPRAALAARRPRSERRGAGPRLVPPPTGRRSTSSASRSRPWSGSAAAGAARRPVPAASVPARRLPRDFWFYRAVVVAGPLSVVALIAGWITTEVGRQPWIVYGYMRTSQAVTCPNGSCRLRARSSSSTSGSAARSPGSCGDWRRGRRDRVAGPTGTA